MSHHIETVQPDLPVEMPYSYAMSVKSGRFVFLSGVGAGPEFHRHPHVDEDFADVPMSAEGQARATMERLKANLERAGGSLTDIVWAIRFHTHLLADQDATMRVWSEYFGDHRPPTATIGVSTLVHPVIRYEVNAIAVIAE